jgi:hypothetical protein
MCTHAHTVLHLATFHEPLTSMCVCVPRLGMHRVCVGLVCDSESALWEFSSETIVEQNFFSACCNRCKEYTQYVSILLCRYSSWNEEGVFLVLLCLWQSAAGNGLYLLGESFLSRCRILGLTLHLWDRIEDKLDEHQGRIHYVDLVAKCSLNGIKQNEEWPTLICPIKTLILVAKRYILQLFGLMITPQRCESYRL